MSLSTLGRRFFSKMNYCSCVFLWSTTRNRNRNRNSKLLLKLAYIQNIHKKVFQTKINSLHIQNDVCKLKPTFHLHWSALYKYHIEEIKWQRQQLKHLALSWWHLPPALFGQKVDPKAAIQKPKPKPKPIPIPARQSARLSTQPWTAQFDSWATNKQTYILTLSVLHIQG